MKENSDRLLIHGGTILTMSNPPRVEAVLVEGNTIVAIGSAAGLRSRIGDGKLEELDLAGRTLIPGFNDNHIHALHMGDHESRPNLDGLSEAEIIDLLKTRYPTIDSGEWIFGYSWDYPSVPNPRKELLDGAFPDNPVVLTQFSGHAAWLNSLALSEFDIGPDTPDWPKGKILKDDSGNPTGIIREPTSNPRIRDFYFRRWARPEFIDQSLRAALPALAKAGITSVQDNSWFPEVIPVLRALRNEGALTARFSCWPFGESSSLASQFRMHRFNKDWYALGPTKFFLDGAFSTHSAWLIEPYEGTIEDFGSGRDSETTRELLEPEIRRSRQCAHHSIGDRATKEFCDAVSKLRRDYPDISRLRLRIEHGQLIRPEDMARIQELGILVCAQPSALIDPAKDARIIGSERARRAYPYRSLIDAGVHLSFGSDYPGEHLYDPIESIHLVVNRSGPEAITPEEALRCYTAESAYAQFEENRKGTISVGKFADFAVLSDDPTSIPAERIREVRVERTIVDGRTVSTAVR